MEIKKVFFEKNYLITLLLFVVLTIVYIPNPRLKEFSLIEDKDSKSIPKKLKLNKKLSKEIKKEIKIGDSYLVPFKNENYFKITPMAFWSQNEFNLSKLSKYLPELILDADEIIYLGDNNYGIQRVLKRKYYQSCLINSRENSFKYQIENEDIVYRYNDYDYWLYIFKREIQRLLRSIRIENFNCLLITSEDPTIFENNSINVSNTISKYFIYR